MACPTRAQNLSNHDHRSRGPAPWLGGVAAAVSLLVMLRAPGTAGPLQAFDSLPSGTPVAVRLRGGAIVEGRYRGRTEDAVRIETESGEIKIPRSALWEGLRDGARQAGEAETQVKDARSGPPPDPKTAGGRWMPQLEAGINGSEGNSPIFNVRVGALAERKTTATSTRASAVFTHAEQDGDLTESRVLADLARDWLIPGSPWLAFALSGLEYDEFKDFDVRVNIAGGPGYAFFRSENTALVGRLGLGASREFGGGNRKVVPEVVASATFDHAFSEVQKVSAGVEFFPDLRQPGEYRFNARAAWEIQVAAERGLHLRLGFEDRFDSTPDGARRNDLDYFLSLVWKF